MTVRPHTTFEIGGVKYYISKVLHLTTGQLSEVHFEQVNFPKLQFIRSGEQFLEKTRSIFPGEFVKTTDLQNFYKTKYKADNEHPLKRTETPLKTL